MRPITASMFWDRFDRTATCWNWTYGCNRKGYGALRWHGQYWTAHRLAYALTYGRIPDGMSVLHHCDNRRCGNPEHLWLGTNADNTYDMIAKGRADLKHGRKGIAHPMSKLTEDNVRDMRQLRADGATTIQIANQYGVSDSHVSRIVNRRQWSHI